MQMVVILQGAICKENEGQYHYNLATQGQLDLAYKWWEQKITFNSSWEESGSITGLNERECGQIGVNNMHGTFG